MLKKQAYWLHKVWDVASAALIALLLLVGAVVVYATTADVRPDATASSTGGSCSTANAHTTLDDDVEAPGGDLCSASTATSNHDIRLNFATPSLTPGNLTNGQTFKVRAINSQTSGSGVATVALDVYCNAVLVSAGSNQNLTDSQATYSRTWTFNSGSCAANGSDVEILLNCTAADNGGTNNDTSCTYDAVEWVANDANNATAPTVTTQSASSVTATAATLNGNITATGGASPTVRGFAWGTNAQLSGGDTATTTENGTFSTGAFTGSLSTLTCNTTYYSRAYATNSAGTGLGSISSSFTTSACVPTVTTQAASSVGATSATANGNITSLGGAASATDRGFAWGLLPGLASGVSTTTESGTFGTGAFTGSLGGLTGNTTYYFRPYAINSAGTGFGTSILNFLTLPDTQGTPTYTNTTATTTGVTWSVVNGGAATYKLEQCQGATCSFFTAITGNSTTTYSLVGNTTYDYAVRGNNATGDGAFSATSSRLTLPDVPGTPTYSGTVATSTTVSWTSPTGGVATYKLQYCVSGSSPCTLSTGLSVTSTTTNPSLTGNTTYSFAVRGTNATGDGLYSASSTRLTVPDVPNAPSISNVVATSTTVTWSAPTGGASTYKLQYCVSGSSPCTLSTGLAVTSTTTNPSLTGNTTYSFAVRGTNATGDGLYSASTTQLTVPNIPGTPTFGSITETTLTVSWTAPTGGATSYSLTRCPTAGGACTFITNILTTSFDDSSLSSNVSYDYAVRGVNATGNGLYSATSSVTTADTTPPAPDPALPPTLSAFSSSEIDMTASTVTDAASSPVQYYLGYFSCVGGDSGTGGTDSGWQTSTSYADTGLQPNRCYGYKEKARDSASPPNATATSSTQSEIYTLANIPGTPALGSAASTTLTLTNTENSNPASNPTTKFAASITATSPSDSTWLNKYVNSAGNPTATETWLSDAELDNLVLRGLTPGTDYTIKIAARNENLVKTASSTGGTGTTLAGTPGTPTFGTVTATTTSVTWTAGTGATSYKLEVCSSATSCNLFTGILSNSTTTYSLVGNTSYDYAVRATNGAGDGAFSATSTKITAPDVPGTPTFSNITVTTLTVSWTAPTGGASTYKLARCTGSGCTDFSNIQTGIVGTSFADSSLSANTTYSYKVLGTNADTSPADGLYSAVAEVTTDSGGAPAATREFRIRGGVRFIGGVRLR